MKIAQIAAAEGHLFCVTEDGSLYRLTPDGWEPIPGPEAEPIPTAKPKKKTAK